MDQIGEDRNEYKTIWGYSASETEARMPLFQYPQYNYSLTSELTNFSTEPAVVPGEELLEIK
jgi:lysine 2,3-aminomutase